MFSRDEAAQIFMQQLYAMYEDLILGMLEVLEPPPQYHQTPQEEKKTPCWWQTRSEKELFDMSRCVEERNTLRQWFQSLSEKDKEYVATLVKHVAHAAYFDLCALLDGISGRSSPPLELDGKELDADFALYLQVYPNFDALLRGQPIEFAVRINPNAGGEGEMLHDMFQGMVGLAVEFPEGFSESPEGE